MLNTEPTGAAALARQPVLLLIEVLAALMIGAAAALGLAWFMHYLITSTETRLQDAQQVQMLDFVRVRRDEVAERRDRTPERPQLSQAPEAPPTPTADTVGETTTLTVSAMPTQADVDIGSATGFGTGEGEYMPIVKVAPIYPRRAQNRLIDGHCLVTYTVTTTGTVKEIGRAHV